MLAAPQISRCVTAETKRVTVSLKAKASGGGRLIRTQADATHITARKRLVIRSKFGDGYRDGGVIS